MSIRKMYVFAAALVTAGMVAVAPQTANADDEGVVRTFLVVVPLDSTLDFLSDDSIGLVVAPPDRNSSNSYLHFSDSAPDPDFASTVWEYAPATHIAVGGAKVPGAVSWLLSDETPTAPPVGAFAFTGMSDDVTQTIHSIRLCSGVGTGCSAAGAYTIDPEYGTELIIVVTAVFSK